MPVFAQSQLPAGPLADGRRGKLMSAAIDCTVVGNIPELEKFGDGPIVDGVAEAAFAQGTDRGCESQGAVANRIHQRLHAEPVADQKELLRRIVPNGEGKHAPQPGYKLIHAPIPVAVYQHFRIGVAAEYVTRAFELGAKLVEIVDGPVEYDARFTAGRQHRLAAGIAEVEDRQTPMAQNRRAPMLDAFSVRTAPRERAGHQSDLLCGAARLGMIGN